MVRHAASLCGGGRLTVVLVVDKPWTLVYDVTAAMHFSVLDFEISTFLWLGRMLDHEDVPWRLVTVTSDAEAARVIDGADACRAVIGAGGRWRTARLRARLSANGVELA